MKARIIFQMLYKYERGGLIYLFITLIVIKIFMDIYKYCKINMMI